MKFTQPPLLHTSTFPWTPSDAYILYGCPLTYNPSLETLETTALSYFVRQSKPFSVHNSTWSRLFVLASAASLNAQSNLFAPSPSPSASNSYPRSSVHGPRAAWAQGYPNVWLRPYWPHIECFKDLRYWTWQWGDGISRNRKSKQICLSTLELPNRKMSE